MDGSRNSTDSSGSTVLGTVSFLGGASEPASDEDDIVQITATREELMRRINTFMQLKRNQVDVSNQQEFTLIRDQIGREEEDDGEGECTCARVDCNRVTKGHITVVRVSNVDGPNADLPTPEQQLWAKLVLLGDSEQRAQQTNIR